MKINYGCGFEYKEGFINIDIDKNTKADIIIEPNQIHLDFEDNSVDYIYSKYCLEHINKEIIHELIKEFHRILKPEGMLELYLPHFTGLAIKHLDHKTVFGIGSFDGFNAKHEDQTMSNFKYPKFNIVKEELHLLPTQPTEFSFGSLAKLTNILDYFFNGGKASKQFWEKYLPGGFEEIHYILIKLKEKEK